MGRKDRKGQRAPVVPPKKEHNERISYLYRAGVGLGVGPSRLETLSRAYLRKMDLVAKKAVVKLHPNIKRTVCKSCQRVLVGQARIRVANGSKSGDERCDVLELACECGAVKRYPVGQKREYELFSERVLYGAGEEKREAEGKATGEGRATGEREVEASPSK